MKLFISDIHGDPDIVGVTIENHDKLIREYITEELEQAQYDSLFIRSIVCSEITSSFVGLIFEPNVDIIT